MGMLLIKEPELSAGARACVKPASSLPRELVLSEP